MSVSIKTGYGLLPRYREHAVQWTRCTACPLCKTRRKVVMYRGQLPCDVLFIGEAPGESENATGIPFIGPAGSMLTTIIDDARSHLVKEEGITNAKDKEGEPIFDFRFGISNIVACWPKVEDETSSGKTRVPNKEEVLACQPRLIEIIEMADPKLIVTLGDTARKKLPTGLSARLGALIHPAAILHRENPSAAALDYKRAVLQLSKYLRSALCPTSPDLPGKPSLSKMERSSPKTSKR
jgi:uracil-DNA glycosylase